jgi:serine/threonine protein kinase
MHMARKLAFHEQDALEQLTENWKQWQGEVIGDRFHLRKLLGDTERSAVFLAEQLDEPRQLAIKLILTDAAAQERLLSQWKLVQKVSHPCLLELLDMGRWQIGSTELLFLAMEYADENLAQVLPHRPLTAAETIEMLSPVLDALAYLHEQGFVHGRLNPANVMAIHDRIRLSSDSVSKANEATFHQSALSIYDAPERAHGEVSAAADVWSLGVLLSQVLTQRLPSWKQRDAAYLVLPQNLPTPFDEVVHGCLQPDPQQRWNVTDIAARLSLTLSLPQKKEAATAFIKKRFVVAAAVALLVVAAIVTGARFLQHWSGPEETSTTELGIQAAPISQPDANRPATVSPTKPSPVSSHSPARVVAASRSVAPDEVRQQVLPDVPQKALATIHGTVRVAIEVTVDPSGNVTAADFDATGPSQYFARLAMQAAKGWTFVPYHQDRDRTFIISFDLTNAGTSASVARATR